MSFTQAGLEHALKQLSEQLPDFSEREAHTMRLLRITSDRLSSRQNELLKEYGINENLWFAILSVYISPNHEILPSRLSDLMDLTRTSATRLSDEMVGRGWIERSMNEKDRRQIVLKLTKMGEDFIKEVQPHMSKGYAPLWKDFSKEEFDQLQALLGKVLTSLGA
ncbi:MarR family transcriptional regulator [Neisseria sp. 83E34]|uniref:MarR family transcriptional regulator n=1 Tax=Neisseria sp. 83E34 TaxID=1692264 RepID=UPI0006CE8EC1|nr:MarR family transcriptional regulator [Neisseria sp. 83E34]KPN72220.1 MarR family transcriptional regulator [Neisseria sp. 83E34]